MDSPSSSRLSSSSSFSSNFSEISSLDSNSTPQISKTSAFFSSPFSTRPPSPNIQPRSESLTITPPSIPLSRLFPSRYNTDSPERFQKPKFLYDVDTVASPITSITLTIPEPDNTTPKPPAFDLASPLDIYSDDVLSPGSIIRPYSPPPTPSTPSYERPSPSHSFSSLPSSLSSRRSLSSSLHDPLLPFPSPICFSAPSLPASLHQNQIQTQNHNISLKLRTPLGQGAFSSVWLADDESNPALADPDELTDPLRVDSDDAAEQKVVAVKLTPRTGGDLERRRTMASFVREVEVLRHISHPNITPLLAHLTTPTHHVLVLPYISGGDLLGLVNSDDAHGSLGENTLRRIWCELCKAVGWMHGVGLVHRDVKLENVLLTRALSPSISAPPSPSTRSPPLIKLTDFGLSRFIDPTAPLLSTRCGSEAYAAPELVIGGRRYDGRETDAWACGVVLFALAGRRLPFGEGVRGAGRRGRIRGDGLGGEADKLALEGFAGREEAERRSWLMRIARGEYEWPVAALSETVSVSQKTEETVTQKEDVTTNLPPEGAREGEEELRGPRLVESAGAKRIVGRLLVRDPGKRATICKLWEDEWMQGWCAGGHGETGAEEGRVRVRESSGRIENINGGGGNGEAVVWNGDGANEGCRVVEVEGKGDGILVDREGIDKIACEEVV